MRQLIIHDAPSNECSWCREPITREDDGFRTQAASGEIGLHFRCAGELAYLFQDCRPRGGAELPYRDHRGTRPFPGHMPFRWQDSDRYSMAIRQYLDAKTIGTELKPRALEDTIAYMRHYIWASCWPTAPGLLNLRLWADQSETIEDIDGFIAGCLAIGLDPL